VKQANELACKIHNNFKTGEAALQTSNQKNGIMTLVSCQLELK